MKITPQVVEALLPWSAPRKTTTYRGPCQIRTADASSKFWALWRTDKAGLQALKVAPKLLSSENKWIVNWYEDLAPASIVAPTPAIAPSARVWSEEQEAIFQWFRAGKGSLVVRARAGTGKTSTIKVAIGYAPEERVIYCCFNKKNQVEAAGAIADPRCEVRTFHSIGLMFIQQVWPSAKPDDEVEKERVESIVGETAPQTVKTQVRKLVGFAKNTLVSPSLGDLEELAAERDIECPAFESEENGGWTRSKLASSALEVLEVSKRKDKKNRISFDDMVWLPVAMSWTRAWFDLVIVDEAQDMNLPQLLMAKMMCKPGGRVVVVGDDRQAIYNFRGAASDGIDMMKQSLQASELGLTTTYRCPKAVVALAALIVPDYKAAPSAPEGLVENIEFAALEALLKVGDAVLSRSNAPLLPVCLSLLRKGTPARIEGRDLGKALAEIVEKLNARTIPQFMTKIEAWGEKQTNRFAGTKNFEAKSEQINDQVATLQAIAEGCSSVREIVSRLTSIFQDSGTDSKPAVILSTTHKAKGLEWNKVFLLSNTFNRRRPANAAPMSPEAAAAQAKEESNIYYVALTRAKQNLVLVSGEARR